MFVFHFFLYRIVLMILYLSVYFVLLLRHFLMFIRNVNKSTNRNKRRIQNTAIYLRWKFLISAVNHFEKELHLDEYASETVQHEILSKLLTAKRKVLFLAGFFILFYFFNSSKGEIPYRICYFLLKKPTKVQWENPKEDKALFLIFQNEETNKYFTASQQLS